ncbi:hypothetical protein [Streptomyces sp. NPDC051636]|uniref:hypothetical protein n=1 Tax=Streptomyces sp. NPDC051636 TaxID=3365663 RepID=UPI00379C69FE
MRGFVVLRARAHRLPLAAALLAALLTTAVLATLTAYAGAIGDAALRHSLADPRNAADTALIVKAEVPRGQRAAADAAVGKGARRTFDGLPVTVRTLVRPARTRCPARSSPARSAPGEPAFTYVAALDRTQVRLVAGRLPHGPAEVALPQTAAQRPGLAPGARHTLADRLDGPPVRVRVTGLYRPAPATASPWNWNRTDVGVWPDDSEEE